MAPGSRASSVRLSQPLPMIIEDIADIPPRVPPKSPRRPPVSNRSSSIRSTASYHSFKTPTPTITGVAVAVAVPKRNVEKGEVLQAEDVNGPNHNGPVARRGWYRILLSVLLVVGIVVGLSVGLTIGLRKRNENNTIPTLPIDIFPAGSYTFTTSLSNISTACSSTTPSPWRCFPYSLYSPSSPSLSAAVYHWTIFPLTRYTYAISSSSNPFAPSFTNVTLSLLDANQPAERFTFSFIHPKLVSSQVGDKILKCWFNTTVLSATIWTRRRASYPANITEATLPAPSPAGGKQPAKELWPAWPFAVRVEETQGESDEVPDCFDGGTGQRIILGTTTHAAGNTSTAGTAAVVEKRDDGQCGCLYKNFDLPEAGNRGNDESDGNEGNEGNEGTNTASQTVNPTVAQAPPVQTETQAPAPIPTPP